MVVSWDQNGRATVKLSRGTWIKILLALAVAVGGHMKLIYSMKTRGEQTEHSVCELKKDFRDTTADLRQHILKLTELLVERKAQSICGKSQ